MNDGVHEPLHPGILRDDPDGPEAAVATQGLADRELLLDDLAGVHELVRDRTLDAHVGKQLLAGAGLGG